MLPSSPKSPSPALPPSKSEKSHAFIPHFDQNGLLTVVVTDLSSCELLMVAWMNEEALRLSIETGFAHFWSRSRGTLWKKGEESGNFLLIKEIRIDCDQDTLWLKVVVQGTGVACHTGQRSCFYRTVPFTLSKEVSQKGLPPLIYSDLK